MDESAVWAIIFANLVGFTLHPGAYRDGAKPPSFSELALLADAATKFYKERYP